MMRLFTSTNARGENVLTLDYQSKWVIEENPERYTLENLRFVGFDITGEAIDRFAALEKSAPRWISVNERLPERDGDYLCYYQHNGNITIRHCYEGDPEGFALSGVTHWQPLPAPPSE